MGLFDGLSAFARVHGVAFGMLAGTVCLAPAAFAQMSPEDEDIDLSGVADIVNLLRMVVDPSPSPVLSSPAERAVSGRAGPSPADSAGLRVVTVKPTVTLPDIVIPEEESDVPVVVAAETAQKEAEPAVAKTLPRASDSDDDDNSDTHPPFYYAFFFGEYVPYYKGWFYYPDAWFWGRRGPRPPEPPGWIPPPPPPDGPFRPGPGPDGGIVVDGGSVERGGGSRTQRIVRPKSSDNTIPVVPDQHRIPGAAARQGEIQGSSTQIPVSTDQHRIPGAAARQADTSGSSTQIPVSASQHLIPGAAARQIYSPAKNDSIPVAPGAHRIPRKNDR